MWSRLLLSLAAAAALAGCVRYFERPYAGDAGIYYGSDYARAHHDPVPVNPAVYPYWSLDYFYFSRYHHPYSVFVGSREPLYYPYPGWFYGSYRGAYAHHGRLSYGYPWFGHGFYPRYSLGFFIAGRHHHGHHGGDHRLRAIDGRLRALQAPRQAPSRSALVGSRRAGIPIGGYPAGYRGQTIRPAGSAVADRAALLHRGSTQRELRSRSRERDVGQAHRAPAPDFGTRQRPRTRSAPPRAAPEIRAPARDRRIESLRQQRRAAPADRRDGPRSPRARSNDRARAGASAERRSRLRSGDRDAGNLNRRRDRRRGSGRDR